jgi:hypothetical protein
MPSDPHSVVAPTWTIRSVAVRTRDGLERLDRVYRHLIDDSSRDPPHPAPDVPPLAAGAARAPEPRR